MRKTTVQTVLLVGLATMAAVSAPADLGRVQSGRNQAVPLAEPVLEAPTLRSLGVYWILGGDENKNARVELDYREVGAAAWKKGPPLFRVERGANKPDEGPSKLTVPADAWLFAGSVVLLSPDTSYEMRLRLSDPDGGIAEKRLLSRTIAEPATSPNLAQFHVVAAGNSGGTGTRDDPFHGLSAAQASAKPGSLFLLHAGVYAGTFTIEKSGEPGRPIIWRGVGDGEVVIDGRGADGKPGERAVSASDIHDVWFERLTIRNAGYGLVGHESARLMIRRCHIYDVDYGIVVGRNDKDTVRGWFISDNVLEGPSTWPRTKGIEDARGIQVTGQGNVVCYNRIARFADAIDTLPSIRCEAIDFHNNDITEMTDDGIEMDYSQRNTRCFFNRLTNVYQGISVQPIFGGPVYIFRNTIYNIGVETFKMHNSPSGALMLHNTSVKKGVPLVLWTNVPVRNSVYRNNLFIGTPGGTAYETTAPMRPDCDFDYDGFGGGPWDVFLKWNNVRYATVAEARANAPVYHHAVLVEAATVFVGGLKPPTDETKVVRAETVDLLLKAGTSAIDAGAILPGFNDDFKGKAPDLGAFEFGGATPPHYGPRPETRGRKLPPH